MKRFITLLAILCMTIGMSAQVDVPLTLETIESGTITFTNKAWGPVTYCIDGGTAQTIASDEQKAIELNKGQKVTLFGNNASYADDTMFRSSNIRGNAPFYVYGNIMSLINSTGYATATESTESFAFSHLFERASTMKSHPTNPLVLPATTLLDYCYSFMFNGCKELTRAPQLPATTIAHACYMGMFAGCQSLTEVPELPAKSSAGYCYNYMFANCRSITTAPQLPATTLTERCYEQMFFDCQSLAAAPELPATELALGCYDCMFAGCFSMAKAPQLPATTLAPACYRYMFQGCTFTEAPALPATTLASECYALHVRFLP